MIQERRRRALGLSNVGIEGKFALAYGVLLLLFAMTCFLFVREVRTVQQRADATREAQAVARHVDDMRSAVLEQQSAVRGFLLTGLPELLEPYRAADRRFDEAWRAARELADDDAYIQGSLAEVRAAVRRWRESNAEPRIRRAQEPGGLQRARDDTAAASASREAIEAIRSQLNTMREHELALFDERSTHVHDSLARTRTIALLMLLAGLLFGIAVVMGTSRNITRPLGELIALMNRLARGEVDFQVLHTGRGDEVGVIARGVEVFRSSTAELATREWSKAHLATLAAALQAVRTHDEFATALTRELAQAIGAVQAALFLWNDRSQRLEPAGGYGQPDDFTARAFRLGEGPVGQAARDRAPIVLRGLPQEFPAIRTGLGAASPRALLLHPLLGREGMLGVVELACFEEPDRARREFLADAATHAALSLETLSRSLATLALLRQTQKHQEELQASEEALRAQQEELQATNESLRQKQAQLEEQGQRLRASEEELRSHADELRQTNAELREKGEELKRQKQALEQAQAALEEKTIDLEQASRYKSEFLANMSHELRTPLNSMLILSKSLADNEDGNLTPDQIESARIVYDSGRNLLSLINDILDLSKVEAGKMQVVVEDVDLPAFASMIERSFRPVATDKKLEFQVRLDPELAPRMRSDGGKMSQIVANLLSNAFKFTSQGRVQLEIARPDAALLGTLPRLGADSVMLRVSDTGIGIPASKMVRIFQAFEQADSGTSRRFGGTGLGLSISKGLTSLLGGEIRVSSEPGRGSVFTVVLPRTLDAPASAAEPSADSPAPAAALPATDAPPSAPSAAAAPPATPAAPAPEPDGAASILIIEDDAQFAEILAGTARARQYRALVAHDGESGIALARRHRPSGILLDIGLPGMDGWQVMNALKADPLTAGIPVHFISGIDEASRALAAGAASFLKKPVSKPQVAAVLDTLPRPKEGARWRILVIDDYAPDRRLIRDMLRTEPVAIDEAATGPEALEKMQRERYDLLVLDLGLPGMDGFEFLEQAAQRGELPAVVIHSGRELTRDEALKLREYTDTIVMKNAPSPQRLLDEVTLFLHSIRRVGTPETTEPAPRVSELAGRTVLVVDDDMRNIFALSKALRARGMKVVMAQDGRKALTQLENNPDIDLVLMDVMMPGMDGYEAMREVRAREQWRRLPIIAVTAKAMVGDREKCIAAGANDYCSKPIDVDRLVEQMRGLLA